MSARDTIHLPSRFAIRTIALLLVLAAPVTATAQAISGQTVAIRTAAPRLYDDWKALVAGQNATDGDARAAAERERPRVQKMEDPFTHLAGLSCAQRRAENVRVIWEDDSLMVLVPRTATSPWLPLAPGSHLLVTPKRSMNFPVDASNDLLAHANRVVAATGDALLVAGGSEPAVGGNNCEMFVSPPSRLGVAQLHVHVVVSRSAAVDDGFFHRTATRMSEVLGGKGCL